MKAVALLLGSMIATTGLASFASAQDASEGGSCAYWYDKCHERGGGEDYCRAKLRSCKSDHCWTEVSGDKHCGLSLEYDPSRFGGKKVFFPHGCPSNLDKECIKTKDGRLIGCRCVS